MTQKNHTSTAVPGDAESVLLIGRVWRSAITAPAVGVVRGGEPIDLSAQAATPAALLDRVDLLDAPRQAPRPTLGRLHSGNTRGEALRH